MLATIRLMVQDVNRGVGIGNQGRQVCEPLTGRPMKADESHAGWFQQFLDEQKGNLTDAQVWMLFLWVAADWMFIGHSQPYPLAFPNGTVATYVQRKWPFAAEPSPDAMGETAEGGKAETAAASADVVEAGLD